MENPAVLSLEVEGNPPGRELIQRLKAVVADLPSYWEKLKDAQDTQYCLWPGQSNDGRAWAANLGIEPFPWDGCHDNRVRLVDEVVNEQQSQMMNAFRRGELQAVAHKSDSAHKSQVASMLMSWMLKQQMRGHVDLELALAANWRQANGCSVLNISWEEEVRMILQPLSIEEFMVSSLPPDQQQAELSMDQVVAFRQSLYMEEQLNGILKSAMKGHFAYMTKAAAKAALTEMRDTGATQYPYPEIVFAAPRFTALRPGVDVFFPLSTDNISRAKWVAWPTFYSKDELYSRVITDGWDEEVVEMICEKGRGKEMADLEDVRRRLDMPSETGSARTRYSGDPLHGEGLHQIIHFYHRAVDDRGIPAVYETILVEEEPDSPLLHRPLPHDHGMMPFVDFRQETKSRPLIESRGISEILMTHQKEVKSHRDRRADRSDITTLPPVVTPGERGGGRYPFSPGAQIPGRRGSKPEIMAMPGFDSTSIEIEENVRRDVAKITGRFDAAVPEPVSFDMQQNNIESWLGELAKAGAQAFRLCQQYMEPVQVSQVVGAGSMQSLSVTREDIRGSYDFSFRFDVRDMTAEFLKNKLNFVKELLTFDSQGTIDRTKLIEYAARSYDPTLAGMILKPVEQATLDEQKDEKIALSMMLSGVEPDLSEGVNNQARLQVLQEQMGMNPVLQKNYQENEVFRALLDNRVKGHQFALQQRQNAQIGRVGTQSIFAE